MRMGFQLFLIIGVIVHSCFATGNIYALDSAAIYEGLLAPENIIGTNLQNLINFVASVVGWAMLVPLYQPPERVGMDRVRRDTDDEYKKISMEKMSNKFDISSEEQMSNHVEKEDELDKVDKVKKVEKVDKVDMVSNLLPSAQTIATVLRSIAEVADLYES